MAKPKGAKKEPFLVHLTPDHHIKLEMLVSRGLIASKAHGIRNALDEYLDERDWAALARSTAPYRNR